MNPKVFVTRRLPLSLEPLEEVAHVEVWAERHPPPYTLLLEKAIECDGLLCLLTDHVGSDLINATPHLKVISQMAVGYDNIDVPAATTRGIPVGHTPGVLTNATADMTWALLMAASRRVVEGDRFVHDGLWMTWEPDLLLGPDVAGATLGIVGLGRIGQAVARRASGFDMRILYTNQNQCTPEIEQALNAEYVNLDTLLDESDFVSIHAPLTEKTHYLFGDRQFERMKSTAILINTARGAIVDPDALCRALTNGTISAAAIDVTEPEPILMNSLLLPLKNLIITPHVGSASRPARQKMAQMAVNNLIAGLKGDRLPHCVNPEVYQP